jgi:hypothetical protein
MNHVPSLSPGELICSVCGQRLLGDPEDQPYPPLGPLCGECYRGQQMDDELDWTSELGSETDDDLDG